MSTAVTAPKPLSLPDGRPAISAWSLDPAIRHLNHGSFGAVPVAAQREQERLREAMHASPVEWFAGLPARVAAARAEIAGLLRVEPDATVLVPNASAGASVVFANLTAPAGGEIVVTDHGYGAVTMGAQRLARRIGGRVRTARVPLGADERTAFEAVAAELTPATALIVLDHVTSPTGRLMPVGEVGREARRCGVPLLVDGAHAPGMFDAPLAGVDCDFWIANLHKFACSPPGAAVLVARGPQRDALFPLIDSWGATAPYPARFDAQGTLDATAYLAAPAAYRFVERTWGWDVARGYMTELADFGAAVVAAAFAALTGQEHVVDVGMPAPALRLVRLPDGLAPDREHADALRDRVGRELGVGAAFSSFGGVGYLRLSAHVYNTAADYEHFAEHCVPVLAGWARD
ncbi:aminotransferase class V-fold PLP-dependent enzyme [Catenulispora subtropica]|uniref:Aminotransferase class V-fold PLP-dependent enzyme n=1 Tax=Catenulispora subtropica TaxID=450798 RepID=A0ABN2SGU5_9ACTN